MNMKSAALAAARLLDDFGYIGSSRLDFTDPRVSFILVLVSLSIFNIYLLSFRPMGWLSGARCLKSGSFPEATAVEQAVQATLVADKEAVVGK